jgi:hypothetical protein
MNCGPLVFVPQCGQRTPASSAAVVAVAGVVRFIGCRLSVRSVLCAAPRAAHAWRYRVQRTGRPVRAVVGGNSEGQPTVDSEVTPEVSSDSVTKLAPPTTTQPPTTAPRDTTTNAPATSLEPDAAVVEEFVKFYADDENTAARALAVPGSAAFVYLDGSLRSVMASITQSPSRALRTTVTARTPSVLTGTPSPSATSWLGTASSLILLGKESPSPAT